MTLHLLDAVLDAKKPAPRPPVNPVIAWLRSPEGEEWSRNRHGRPEEISHDTETWWRATGPLTGDDPCGAGPLKSGEQK
jgi:hypothetical protein